MAGLPTKIPPQNIEAEQSVLGSLLMDKDAVIKIADSLHVDDFYRPDHAEIYGAIIKLFEKRKPIDVLTLADELEKEKKLKSVGGASYLTTIVNSVPTSAHVTTYANIVHQKATLRRLVSAASSITELGFDETSDLETILDRAESTLFNVSQKYVKQYFTPIKDILMDSFERIDKLHKNKGAVRGVPTGFKDLDNLLAGFQRSDLIIVAARPSIGKSSFILNIADYVACDKKMSVGIFSLEMSKEQIIDRLLCSRGSVDSWKLRTGNLEDEDFGKLNYAMGILSESNIFIDDAPFLNVMEIRTKARRLQMEHGLDLIVIDYLQLMSGTNTKISDSRVQEVSEISRSLKSLAREINVPVVALSQLSRAVEHRPDKRPMLADLRESGCLVGDSLITRADTGDQISISEIAKQKKSIPIFTLNKEKKLEIGQISKAFSSGQKKVFELITASGRKISASANHPFFAFNGFKRLDQLKVGEHIAISRVLNLKNQSNNLSKDQLILLGHLIGDGCYLAKQPLHYTSADMGSIEIVKKAAETVFKVNTRIIKQKNWYHLYLSAPYKLARGIRNPIVKWLDEDLHIFNQRSGDKILPKQIFRLSLSKLALFLSHLWSTDGTISFSHKGPKFSWTVAYSTKSEEMARQIQHLLLRFGIISRLKKSPKKGYDPGWIVDISGQPDQLLFLKQVGIFGCKAIKVEEAINYLSKLKPNPNKDIIPKEVWKLIENVRKNCGQTTRSFHQKLGWAYSGTSRFRNGLSRQRLAHILSIFPDNELENLANSDIYWDEVKSITYRGIEEVYDATVPQTHNFIANDFIVHNSIEQDADVVMFLYRDDYYEPDSERKNIAEILIKKHRNGPIGDIELYWKPEYMKFATVERKLEPAG